MIIKLNYKDASLVIMEQAYKGAKVKITVINKSIGGGKNSKDVIWTDKDNANKFYQKRIKDGYVRV